MMLHTFMRTLAIIITALFATLSSWAGYNEAYEAYERGDYATALKEWRPLAEQGFAPAQYNLGLMYTRGEGVPQDYNEAVRWYQLAATQGFALAQLNLGTAYLNGNSVAQDYAEAMKWFRAAAEQGNIVAQMKVGLMYKNGWGVTQDYVQAHVWFNLAGVQGDKDAAEWRDNLAKKMTPAQIAEAQRLAREWKPKKP